MKFSNKAIIFLFLILLFNACATYKAQYADEENEIQFPDKPIEKTFYLIGDAGLSPQGGLSEGLKAFQDYISDKENKRRLYNFSRR